MISGPRYASLNQTHAKAQTEQQFRTTAAEVTDARLDRQTSEARRPLPAPNPAFIPEARAERLERGRARPLIAEEKAMAEGTSPSPTRPHPTVAPVGPAPAQLALGSTTRLYKWGEVRAARVDDAASLERPAAGETSKHFEWRRMVNARIKHEREREARIAERYPKPDIDIPLGPITESSQSPFGRTAKPEKAIEKAGPDPEL